MHMKHLSDIVENITILDRLGEGDPSISELAYDSREVRPDTLFFALKGLHTDGHGYIERAVQGGGGHHPLRSHR